VPPTGFTDGSVVTFDICVTSQGNIAADAFTISDYIPAGLMFDAADPNNADWTLSGDVATTECTGADIPGASLEFGEQVCKQIDLRVIGGELDYVNVAEISAVHLDMEIHLHSIS